MDAINFFKSLDLSDWNKKVTEKWTVKDVLSHLVGWEREVAVELHNTFKDGKEPWFMEIDDYIDFNNKIYNEFKSNSPEELLMELERWEEVTKKEIQEIGEEKIRQREHVDWIFDEGEEPHFEHHIKQVKKALNK